MFITRERVKSEWTKMAKETWKKREKRHRNLVRNYCHTAEAMVRKAPSAWLDISDQQVTTTSNKCLGIARRRRWWWRRRRTSMMTSRGKNHTTMWPSNRTTDRLLRIGSAWSTDTQPHPKCKIELQTETQITIVYRKAGWHVHTHTQRNLFHVISIGAAEFRESRSGITGMEQKDARRDDYGEKREENRRWVSVWVRRKEEDGAKVSGG